MESNIIYKILNRNVILIGIIITYLGNAYYMNSFISKAKEKLNSNYRVIVNIYQLRKKEACIKIYITLCTLVIILKLHIISSELKDDEEYKKVEINDFIIVITKILLLIALFYSKNTIRLEVTKGINLSIYLYLTNEDNYINQESFMRISTMPINSLNLLTTKKLNKKFNYHSFFYLANFIYWILTLLYFVYQEENYKTILSILLVITNMIVLCFILYYLNSNKNDFTIVDQDYELPTIKIKNEKPDVSHKRKTHKSIVSILSEESRNSNESEIDLKLDNKVIQNENKETEKTRNKLEGFPSPRFGSYNTSDLDLRLSQEKEIHTSKKYKTDKLYSQIKLPSFTTENKLENLVVKISSDPIISIEQINTYDKESANPYNDLFYTNSLYSTKIKDSFRLGSTQVDIIIKTYLLQTKIKYNNTNKVLVKDLLSFYLLESVIFNKLFEKFNKNQNLLSHYTETNEDTTYSIKNNYSRRNNKIRNTTVLSKADFTKINNTISCKNLVILQYSMNNMHQTSEIDSKRKSTSNISYEPFTEERIKLEVLKYYHIEPILKVNGFSFKTNYNDIDTIKQIPFIIRSIQLFANSILNNTYQFIFQKEIKEFFEL